MSSSSPKPRPPVLAVLVGLLAVLVFGPLLAPPAWADADEGGPVVFVGVAGLSWSDVSPGTTPALWEATGGAVGSLSVRSVRRVTCPLDGWLAVNSSSRAAGTSARCDDLTDPVETVLPVWPSVLEAVAEQNYSARLGVLHDNLTAAGVDAVGIGPGAGVALADAHGVVGDHESRLSPREGLAGQVSAAVSGNDLVVIDAGALRPVPRGEYSTPEQIRSNQVRMVDERVGAILEGVADAGRGVTFILASLADDAQPSARVFAMSGPGITPGVITSPSTRQAGYSLTTDLQATILDRLGTGGQVQGNPVTVRHSNLPQAELVAAERDRELQSLVLQPPIIPTFFFTLVVVNVALYAAVAVGLRRPNISKLNAWWARRTGKVPPDTLGAWLPPRRNVLRGLRVIALAVGALPPASYLANLLPWWRSSAPGLVLTVTILVMIALITALALAGPWRRTILGPPAVIAGVLALILGVDVALGSPLQLGSVMGNPPVVAGRWYGMNNTAFAQFTTSMIILATVTVQPLIRRNHRAVAAVIIVIFGAFTAFMDGAPFLGADFGGPPAILPAFLILALLAAGIRITVRRVSLVFLGTALVAAGIAFADWLRPPEARSHIGNFFQQVLDGELFIVVWRKLDANLRVLMGNRPLTILALSALALVVFVLARPIRTEITAPEGGRFSWLSGGTPISAMTKQAPLLGSALIAAGIVAGLGMAANDSGIAIPANVAAVFVPALIAATATWMLTLKGRPDSSQEDEPVAFGAED